MSELTVLIAGADDRDFFLKFYELFEDCVLASQFVESGFDVVLCPYLLLPLAVVTESGGFEYGRNANTLDTTNEVI